MSSLFAARGGPKDMRLALSAAVTGCSAAAQSPPLQPAACASWPGPDSLTERQAEELFSSGTIIHCSHAGQTAAQREKSLEEQSRPLRNLFLHLPQRNLAQVSGMPLRIETTVENLRRNASERLRSLRGKSVP